MNPLPLLLLTAAGVQNPKSHVTTPSLEAQVKSAYAGYAKAILQHDIDKVMSYLTPDVVWKYPDGKSETAKSIKPAMKAWIVTLKPDSKLTFSIKRVRATRSGIEAWVTMNFDGWVVNSGKTQKAKFSSAWHDSWVVTKAGLQNKVGENLLALPQN